jgi:hypothetical protein
MKEKGGLPVASYQLPRTGHGDVRCLWAIISAIVTFVLIRWHEKMMMTCALRTDIFSHDHDE